MYKTQDIYNFASMDMKKIIKSNIHKIGGCLLAVTLFVSAASPVQARKKDKVHHGQATVVVCDEPDALAAKSVGEKRMMHAAAVFMRTSNARINSKYKEGIDVSHYQGSINWDEVVDGTPISYVYLKATEGASLVDDTYERNLAEARRVGLSVGSYQFYRPNIDWKKQFDNMTSIVKSDEQDLVPIIDIEHRGSVSSEAFISDLRSFIEKVTEYYGKKPLLYTYHNFYNSYLQGEFTDYHFMIARYRSDSPTLNDGKDYIMWQYTSRGSIPGIRGHVDRSKIMGSYSLNQVMM